MKSKFTPLITFRILLIACVLLAMAASVQSYYLPVKKAEGSKYSYTHFNNYLIFKQSHFHLLEGKDLYAEYPEEHWDYFKYSPTFALFFGIFAWLPDLPGIMLWNLLNTLALFFAIAYLPFPDTRKKNFLLITLTWTSQNQRGKKINFTGWN